MWDTGKLESLIPPLLGFLIIAILVIHDNYVRIEIAIAVFAAVGIFWYLRKKPTDAPPGDEKV